MVAGHAIDARRGQGDRPRRQFHRRPWRSAAALLRGKAGGLLAEIDWKSTVRQRQIALSSCRERVAPCRPTEWSRTVKPSSDCRARAFRAPIGLPCAAFSFPPGRSAPGPGRTRALRARGHIEAARLSLERWQQRISAGVAHRRFRGATRTASYATSKTRSNQRDVDSRYASLPLGSGFLPRRVSTPMPDSGGRNGRYSSFGAKRPAEDIEAAQSIVGRREQW